MPQTIHARPDADLPAVTTVVPGGEGWAQNAWAHVTTWVDTVPPIVWVGLIAVTTLVLVLLIPFLRTSAFKAGARHGKQALTDEERRDRRLLLAAMIPASLFWIAVLVGSGRGLIAFGKDDLRWTGGWEFLVPFTLDGVAIAFALLAFRAVKKSLNPDRAVRIAGAAMVASAGINFMHEVGGSKLGAGYLAILSLLGMLIFDELLSQFEEGAATAPARANPKFGLRWLTWPTNTMCAWVAWRNYPPAKGLEAAIGNAVKHLEWVREQKTLRRANEIDSPVWWMRLAPWTHVAALRVAMESERAGGAEKLAETTATVTDLTTRLDRQDVQLRSERASAAEYKLQSEAQIGDLQKKVVDTERRLTDESTEALRKQRETLLTEMAERVAEAKAKARIPDLDEHREKARGDRTRGTSKVGSPKTILTDEEAVQKLLAHPGDPAQNVPPGDVREWSQKAITTAVGVGFGRAPRLVEMVTEAQRLRASETDSGDQAVNQ